MRRTEESQGVELGKWRARGPLQQPTAYNLRSAPWNDIPGCSACESQITRNGLKTKKNRTKTKCPLSFQASPSSQDKKKKTLPDFSFSFSFIFIFKCALLLFKHNLFHQNQEVPSSSYLVKRGCSERNRAHVKSEHERTFLPNLLKKGIRKKLSKWKRSHS